MRVPSWGEFEADAPALAAFGAERLTAAAAYLATVRRAGTPRVHPVAPIIGGGRLFLFMEPTSPKVHDLRERGSYALHSGVPDNAGTGGEFLVTGRGTFVDDAELRTVASEAATYQPELEVGEARSDGYGDVTLPDPGRWAAPGPT
jgi:hypothetical protein